MKLTPAQRRLLQEANDHYSVDAYMQSRRSVERLAARGLLRRTGLVSYDITDAGRAALTLVSSNHRGGK